MIEKLVENPTSAALGWLLEMEVVNSPAVMNTLMLNIFRISRLIKDANFVVDTHNKRLLIYVECYFGLHKLFGRRISRQVTDMLDQILPDFKKRVVFDRNILNKALDIIKSSEINSVRLKNG